MQHKGTMVPRLRLSPMLELRALTPADTTELYSLTKANQEHLKQWFAWANDIQSPTQTLDFIRESQRKQLANKAFDAGIYYDNRLCGVIGMHEIKWQNRLVEIGYWLAEAYTGKGIMTQAVKAFCAYGFDTLRLNRIELICAAHNTKSQAIAKRLGFRNEGTSFDGMLLNGQFYDEYRFALLKRDFDQAAALPSKSAVHQAGAPMNAK